MWFGKSIMTKLGLALALAVPAFAADVSPFYFDKIGDHLDPSLSENASAAMHQQNQSYWNYLMKFKLWGTKGIVAGRAKIADSVGWIGTASVGFRSSGYSDDSLGGPIIIGGDIDLTSGGNDAQFSTGPIRTTGTIKASERNIFHGTVCAETGYSGDPSFVVGGADSLLTGSKAKSGACVDDLVPFVKTDLTIPSVHAYPSTVLPDIKMDANVSTQTQYITVPASAADGYDVHIKNITFYSSGHLYVRVPNKKTLVRIFVDNLTLADHPYIQVQIPDGNGGYKTLPNKCEEGENDCYKGNLMFYTEKDIVFDNTDNTPIQGTFITKGKITCKKNMKFAGQLIASELDLGAEIKGGDFVFVPFDPPEIDPTTLAQGVFKEDDEKIWEIPITLDADAKNKVTFKYCFDVHDKSVTKEGVASIQDFNKSTYNSKYPAFPICEKNEYGEVVIPSEKRKPTVPVYLSVRYDSEDEPTETLYFKVFDLTAAVFPEGNEGGDDSGIFPLYIQNTPLFNFKDVKDHYDIEENSAIGDTVAKIEIVGVSTNDLLVSMADNDADANPVLLNDLFNIAVDPTNSFVAITVKNHDELNYESSRIKQIYDITMTLTEDCGAATCQAKTAKTKINVTDINEPPYFVEFGPYTIPENSEVGVEVDPNRAHADDPDKDAAFNTLVYSIPVNEDADKTNDVPFKINSKTGVITVADKSKMDYETHPLPYVFDISVFDNLNTVPQEIQISILDVNEPPVIIDTTGDTIKVAENSPVDLTKMAYFEVSDPDADDAANLLTQIVPTIKDNKKKTGVVSAEDLFDMVMEKAKDANGVDKYWAVLKVKADIDFEAIMAARNDSVFDVTLTFTDQQGAGLDTSIAKKIAVTDVNEKPYFTDVGPFDVKENSAVGTLVGEVKAADDDIKTKFNTLYYTIPVNEDSDPDNDVPFAIVNKTSGEITVANKEALDFEDPSILEHKFEFEVQVTDGEFPITTLVTIKLVDDDEPPIIIPECEGDECIEICKGDKCEVCVGEGCHETCVENCDKPYGPQALTVSVDENSPTGYPVMSYLVRDEDYGTGHTKDLTAKIVNTNNSGADTLFIAEMKKDANGDWRVSVSVIDGTKLDYETVKESHNVTIYVYDPEDGDGLYDSLLRVIKVVDLNEVPTITGVTDFNKDIKDADKAEFTFYPKESVKTGDSIGFVIATDPDTKHENEFARLEYSVVDPNGDIPFIMKDSLLVVKDASLLNYESAKTEYKFDVQVDNCEWEKSGSKYVKTDRCLAPVTKTVTVKLQDVEEPPIIIPECEGDECIEICKGDKCEICVGESCHETCVENCDSPYGPTKVLNVSVDENSPTGYKVMSYLVSDEDYGFGHTKDLTAKIKNTNNSGADTLFVATMEQQTSGEWRVVVSVIDGTKLDYEKVKETHNVTIYVYDPEDPAGMYDSLLRVIKVVDLNETPTIAGVTDFNKDIKDADKAAFTFYPKESVKTGDSIGFVIATDPDTKHEKEFARLEYSVVDPNGDIPFIMKDSLLVVEDASLLNYESAKTEYKFDVQVDNCEWEKSGSKYVKTDRCLAPVTKTVTVKLQDVEEPPIIIPECEGDECIEICKGDKCEICVGESCHETCVENCDSPYGPTKVLNVSVDENSPTGYKVMSYLVSDEDYGFGHTKDLTAKIKNTNNSGADSLFVATMEQQTSGEWRVVVSVIDRTKLDYEKVKETHNVTIYVYDPEDPAGMYDSLLRVIKVVDVNEAPSLVKPVEFDMDENTPAGTVVQKMVASDPDSKNKKFRELKYSIISTDPVPFEMDSNRVKVTELLNYEKSDTTFTFKVKVEDKYDPTLFDIADVTVHVKNVNEDPVIIPDDCEGSDCTDDCIGDKCGDGKDDSPKCIEDCDDVNQKKKEYATIGIEENSKKGTELFRYSVFDEDFGEIGNLSVKAVVLDSTVKNKTALTDLFDLKYDKTKHEIVMTLKDSTKLDYEALRQAKTRNDPDPEYKVAIVVTDPKGLTDTLFRVIRIVDVNELPLFTVWPLVITENNKVPDTLGHVEHPSDIDSLSRNPALYDNYPKMTDGNIDLFDVVQDPDDPMRILLVTDVKLDCESGKVDENGVFKYDYNCGQDSAYWVVLTYGDTTLGPDAIHADQRVPVKLVDLNELPEIKTDTIGVDENSPKGTVVDTIKWFDIDRFDTAMTFKIVNDPIGCFAIDSKTGVVTVKSNKCSGLDYEKNPTIDLKVSITDLVGVPDSLYDDKCKCQLIYTKNGLPNTVEKTIKVYIHDVNEPPSITDKTIHVKEDTKPKTVVDTVRATDPDTEAENRDLTYTLIDGDTATFKIEPKTGALILKDSLDYEDKASYYVIVRVDDGEFADTAKVKIIIDDVKEWTKVKITEASTKRKTWEDPEVIYTSEPIREICWNQDGFDTCMTDLNIAKDTLVVVEWKNPTKNYIGRDSVRIYFNNAIPAVSIKADTTLVTADNVFTIVEDMGEADTNIYLNKPKDSIFVVIKDPASKLDTTFKIEVGLEPIEPSKVQSTLDKMTKITDSKIMRDETAKDVVETAVNSNQFKYSYNEIIGKDTVQVSYMTDKDGEPIKVPVVNEKGKVDSVEIITVTYKAIIDGQKVEVSYQADALTGQVYVKGPAGELMEQGASKKLYGSSSKSGKDSTKSTKSTYDVNEGMFTITTGGKDVLGNDRVISYSVDKKGNMVKNTEGDAGYSVTYSFVNKYGNVATESVFIVVDQVGPVVEILSPVDKEVVRSNSVKVVWTVDGIEQDTLTLQGLSKGPNVIVRFYRDKAGNEASDTVYVFMKDSKDVDISVEQPVTEISADKIEEYYAVNPPEKGETFAVSIKNPTTGEEVETLIGGSFKTKEGSGKEPYPGVSGSNHLGPTLAMDIKVPIATAVGGLATLDDIVTSGNMISLKGVDAKESPKITVEEYVEEYCEADFELPSDLSKVNLYDTKLHAQIWVYTSLGNFVDYFSFTQELNDPSYTDDAGLLKMYFEMKPDKDGFVKADNGKQYATGAFVYKVQARIRSKARCTIPDQTYGEPGSLADGFSEATKRKGDVIKNSDELLKSFGYRRPQKK